MLGLVALVASMGLGVSASAADTTPPANDAVTSPTVVTQAGLPFSASQDSLTATVNTGGIADPAPVCAGGATGYSVWYRFTPRTNLTARVEVTGGDWFPPDVNVYQGRVGQLTAHGCVQSGTSQSLWLRGGTTYYFMLTSYTGRPTFTFTITPVTPPANDAVTSPTVVTQAGLPFSASQDSLTATVNTGGIADPAPVCAGGATGYSVWYRFTPRTNLTARVEVTGGDWFPPDVNVYQGRVGQLTAHGCVQSGTSQSLWLRGGTTYYFMLTSYTGRPTFTFTITP